MHIDPAVMAFLQTRRSRPAKLLGLPVPDRDTLMGLLTAASRAPDHGKLEPWRFAVLERAACMRFAGMIDSYGADRDMSADVVTKASAAFAQAHQVVAVIASPKPSDKVPQIEQTLSAGAVCLGLVNAALASGFGANWLTGWAAHDRDFIAPALDLQPQEWVAGFIHLGTARAAPPERPRPDVAGLTRFIG
ncbi:nitroreductase family protein [Roseinatronobacter alkalisoli]|uniref:Putative NAD(P)H nitroreductase n=1 Tax=Roseinatronobacter alkalisoli TaxID=3028235 RepID=A0ABT5T4H2_9RHOB|nr:nitroreductase [Roseinatronobacter sp. HJB301]MDD7970013.1 nitroreductase [Roseinatronobacter sp. HJB301]